MIAGVAARAYAAHGQWDACIIEWRRALRSGMKHGQRARIPLYEQTKPFCVYEPGLVPGFFRQWSARQLSLRMLYEFDQIPHDVMAVNQTTMPTSAEEELPQGYLIW